MEKLIITAAICGAEVTKAQNEAVPYTIDEMVREAKSAYEAGAAILHIHVREDDGTPTQDRERFKVVMDAIRKELPDVIMIPSTGGATGIALGVNRVLGLPVSGVLFAINISMLVLGWMVLGSRFALTTIASTILSPLFLALWERVFADFVLTDDLVLNTIFAGLGVGISLGITIRAGASTGGMDIPPLVLNKWFHLPVSSTMMVFDFIILAAQAAFSPVRQSLYGVVMAIIYTVVLDKVLMLGTTRTEVKIISAKSDEICAAIFAQLDRGVTILHGEGGYLREPESVLLSVVSNRQLPRLEKLAHTIDPTCFMIVSHVTEVSGRGFSLEKNYQAEG